MASTTAGSGRAWSRARRRTAGCMTRVSSDVDARTGRIVGASRANEIVTRDVSRDPALRRSSRKYAALVERPRGRSSGVTGTCRRRQRRRRIAARQSHRRRATRHGQRRRIAAARRGVHEPWRDSRRHRRRPAGLRRRARAGDLQGPVQRAAVRQRGDDPDDERRHDQAAARTAVRQPVAGAERRSSRCRTASRIATGRPRRPDSTSTPIRSRSTDGGSRRPIAIRVAASDFLLDGGDGSRSSRKAPTGWPPAPISRRSSTTSGRGRR